MPTEPSPAASSSDDFDRQLREIASGAAGAARFRELSAAERARLAGGERQRWPRALRKRLAARKLRKPASGPPRTRTPAARTGRRRLRVVGGRSYRAAPAMRRQRLLSALKVTGVLVGFAALLIVLHLLGFGPH